MTAIRGLVEQAEQGCWAALAAARTWVTTARTEVEWARGKTQDDQHLPALLV
ncbi:hypothetical protein [Streptomyces sp. NPDC051286]|uniref:hypothetical protein n=1 Tax=Streptomyces sp. NPDC051286 TaxID=3365647 RepID=UPI0037B45ABF